MANLAKGMALNKIIWEERGKHCQVCGKKLSLRQAILHHIKNRKDGGELLPENLELRCQLCEQRMHKHYPEGNGGVSNVRVSVLWG